MKNNESVITMLRRPFWVLVAVLCIVFSSASKRLIEQKVAPYFTSSQSLGKKIKDGSRDKRQFFQSSVQSQKQNPGNATPEILFLLSSLIAFAFLFLSGRVYNNTGYTQPAVHTSHLPLYLRMHRLQV